MRPHVPQIAVTLQVLPFRCRRSAQNFRPVNGLIHASDMPAILFHQGAGIELGIDHYGVEPLVAQKSWNDAVGGVPLFRRSRRNTRRQSCGAITSGLPSCRLAPAFLESSFRAALIRVAHHMRGGNALTRSRCL